MSDLNTKNTIKAIVAGIVFLFVGLPILFGTWGTVGAGERGVNLRFGATTGKVVQPGFYFKLPWIESVVTLDVQTQVEKVEASAASKDLQNVSTQVGLNYKVNSEEAIQLYRDIGQDYKEKIIDPAIQDAVKAATAKFTAEELITKREEVKDDIVTVLKLKFVGQHLDIVALNITNFKFSNSFEQAIEAKVTAEQNALAAKNKLDQVKYEADQRVAEADGEAKAIAIQAQAIQQQGGAAYIQLKAIEKWSGILPQYMLGNSTPFINLQK